MEMTQEQREAIRIKVKKLAVYAIENLDKQDKEKIYDNIDTITNMVSNIFHDLKTPESMPMTMEEKDI